MVEWAIETHELTKRYGYRPVLSGVDLCVKPGEFLVLFGPNGAGKSTLIRILCTLMKPSGGTAKVAGYNIADDPDKVRASIGLIGHSSYLYEDLTAVENMRFYLRMRGVDAIERRLAEALQLTGLERARSNQVRTFSTGMKKRLCIARIVAYPPHILFLDEPYSGLDEEGIRMLNRFLLALKTEGCTVFMVTHHREQGLATGDRALYLDGGKLRASSPLPLGEGQGEGEMWAPYTNPHPSPLPRGEGAKARYLRFSGMAGLRTIYFLLAKDLLVELRNRETFTVMLFFAVVMLFLFHFSLNPERENTTQLAPGLLWLAFMFTGVLGLGRSFQAEQANDCLEQLLLVPGDRGNIFLGKLLGNMAFMLAVELLIMPLFALFFQLNLWDALLPLLVVAVLGTLGFAAIGTLFSALTANLRAREVLFPLLLFPLVVPVIIGTVTATGVILGGGTLGEASGWLKLLGAFDTIFLAVAYLTFEFVVEQ